MLTVEHEYAAQRIFVERLAPGGQGSRLLIRRRGEPCLQVLSDWKAESDWREGANLLLPGSMG